MLGASTQLSAASGIFAVYGLGSISALHYYWLAVVGLGLAALLLLLAITLRETPRWLIKHGYNSKALENMIFFKGNNYDVSSDLAVLEMQIGKEKTINGINVLQKFGNRSTFHPLVLSIIVMFFQQFCGINAVVFYAEDIFEQTKYKNNAAFVSSFAVGGTELFGTLIGVILTDLLGRRVLLVCSGIGMFLSSGAMGAFYFLNLEPYCHPGSSKCMDDLNPLAITSIILYVMSFSIAWGGLPWLLLSEMLPLRVRGAGMGIAGGASWIFAAVVTGFFKEYQKALKPWGAFWSFSLICVLSVLFVIIFIPETKGKSLEDIDNYFSKKSHKDYNEFMDGELSISTDLKWITHNYIKCMYKYTFVTEWFCWVSRFCVSNFALITKKLSYTAPWNNGIDQVHKVKESMDDALLILTTSVI